jgi:hypothetical protein
MSASNTAMRFFSDCVGWPRDDVDEPGGLCDMIQAANDITRKTFLQHVDRADLAAVEAQLSYASHPRAGLTMAGDWAVSYHRSKLHGERVYYFRQSAIEYVFRAP